MQKHFVTFFSPGTFVAETSEQPIDAWDTEQAIEMAHRITERHNATPYGFRFSTRTRGAEDLDSKVTKTSPMYFLGGVVETLAQVKARATEKDRALIGNMEGNGYARIITNTNSWKWTQPLKDDDVVLDFTPRPRPADVSREPEWGHKSGVLLWRPGGQHVEVDHPHAAIWLKVLDHPQTDQCDDPECCVCGMRDCPDREPLHYHHDGCPCCAMRPADV